MTANGDRVSFGGDENVLELGVDGGCTILRNVFNTIELFILRW